MQKWIVLLVLVTLCVLVGGCTSEVPSEQQSAPVPTPTLKQTAVSHTPVPTATAIPVTTLKVSDNTIIIKNNAFTPSANMTVKVHSTVRWVNSDDHPHNIEFANKVFSTSHYLLGTSQSFSQQFDSPGIYDYDCLVYPTMRGTITVVE
ncbi:MAG: plastocyanin/azurin family copper-binding protein [Methanoregula sp.]|jgi:plastocyanin|uniref:plastocyanin/azurin family copper-binding protein n=1 Tax=Methanoregula sp. TaxID=2052170 RepID=UPI0025E19852|nr:plastocyanin/azurin family copper-binding protein [Methanoregula sp.]MCK9631480.1 plastocyanin/azurin family copper-binding protein [Methanoregula sp.]